MGRNVKYNSPGRVFIGNLDKSVDEETLKNVFSTFGPIVDVEVVRSRRDNESRGFAFLSFKNVEDADLVINKHQGMLVKGKPVNIDSATNSKSRGGGYRSRSRERFRRRSRSPQGQRRFSPVRKFDKRNINSDVLFKLATFMRNNNNMRNFNMNQNSNPLAATLMAMINGNQVNPANNNISLNTMPQIQRALMNNNMGMNSSAINMLQSMLASQNINPQNLTSAGLLSLLGGGNLSQTNLQNSANVLAGNISMNSMLNSIITMLCSASGLNSGMGGCSNGNAPSQLSGLSNFLMNSSNQNSQGPIHNAFPASAMRNNQNFSLPSGSTSFGGNSFGQENLAGILGNENLGGSSSLSGNYHRPQSNHFNNEGMMQSSLPHYNNNNQNGSNNNNTFLPSKQDISLPNNPNNFGLPINNDNFNLGNTLNSSLFDSFTGPSPGDALNNYKTSSNNFNEGLGGSSVGGMFKGNPVGNNYRTSGNGSSFNDAYLNYNDQNTKSDYSPEYRKQRYYH